MAQHYNSLGDWQFLNESFLKEWEQKLSNIGERYLAEDSLYEFFKAAWPYIEGNMPYIDSWHIRAIAEHLEAVYARQIKKLIINVPPRTGKTNLISVAFCKL